MVPRMLSTAAGGKTAFAAPVPPPAFQVGGGSRATSTSKEKVLLERMSYDRKVADATISSLRSRLVKLEAELAAAKVGRNRRAAPGGKASPSPRTLTPTGRKGTRSGGSRQSRKKRTASVASGIEGEAVVTASALVAAPQLDPFVFDGHQEPPSKRRKHGSSKSRSRAK